MLDHSITIPFPPDIAERDRARRVALRAARVEHPGLASLDARIVPGGVSFEYGVPDGTGPLPALPTAEEALAILAPVAAGLALLHDAGLAHGDVRLESLRRTAAGAGVLVGWRPDGEVAGDLEGLVAAAHALLPSGSVGSEVAQALVWAGDPDPSGVPEERRTMARLASVLESARRRLTARPAGDPAVPPSPPALRRVPAVDPGASAPDTRGVGVVGGAGTRDSSATPHATPAATLRILRPAGRVSPPRTVSGETPGAEGPIASATIGGPSPRRARHAARRSASMPRWRWLIAAAGAVVVAVTSLGALRAADAQSAAPAGMCAATVAAE